ncbi:gem-associated protein 8-like [Mytilus trossulus]|uniref:gem-associated protein 8-like n=1 Tax=Mytilus trossulus TaxID=6551 RepID=UPI003007CDFF
MDADTCSSKTSSELDLPAEEATDSLADILSTSDSSESSLTSLTSDNLLQQMSTEEETLKLNEQSETETDTSDMTQNTPNNTELPNLSSQDWYLHPLFQGYWRHYAHAMSWCQTHRIVTQKLLQNQQQIHQRHSQPYSNSFNPKRKSKNLKTSKHPMFKKPKSKVEAPIPKERRKQNVSFSEESTTCDDTHLSDTGSEVYEMEITDEMVDFFAQSEKHRKERDESKLGGGKGESLVDIGKASKKVPTSEAPKERPGIRRTSEMTQLYGKGAAMIHGMETALQMTYDRNVDIKQPPCWPNMPLKIVFR